MTMAPNIGGFTALDESHRELLWWCDVLEAIAEYLPCRIDEQVCSRMATRLVPLVEETWTLAEYLIFPDIDHCADAKMPDGNRRQLPVDRPCNCEAARDVIALFQDMREGKPLSSPAAASHRLRSFTRKMRCRIVFERNSLAGLGPADRRCDEPPGPGMADAAAA